VSAGDFGDRMVKGPLVLTLEDNGVIVH
jgi:hypothetical protein